VFHSGIRPGGFAPRANIKKIFWGFAPDSILGRGSSALPYPTPPPGITTLNEIIIIIIIIIIILSIH
jgi:hypothetical protein